MQDGGQISSAYVHSQLFLIIWGQPGYYSHLVSMATPRHFLLLCALAIFRCTFFYLLLVIMLMKYDVCVINVSTPMR